MPKFNAFKQFTRETTLDGFKQIYEAESKAAKVYWITLLILALSATCSNIVRSSIKFFNHETTSTVKAYMPVTFPNILVCPEQWRKQEVMEEYGFTNTDDVLMASIFPIPTYKFLEFNKKADYSEIVNFTQKLDGLNIDAFFTNISYDFHEVLRMDPSDFSLQHMNITLRNVLSTVGMCYEVKVDGKITPSSADHFSVNIGITKLPVAFATDRGRVNINMVYVGSGMNEGFMSGETMLSSDMHYAVKIRPKVLVRASRPELPCNVSFSHSWRFFIVALIFRRVFKHLPHFCKTPLLLKLRYTMPMRRYSFHLCLHTKSFFSCRFHHASAGLERR